MATVQSQLKQQIQTAQAGPHGAAFARRDGASYVSPYAHPDVIAVGASETAAQSVFAPSTGTYRPPSHTSWLCAQPSSCSRAYARAIVVVIQVPCSPRSCAQPATTAPKHEYSITDEGFDTLLGQFRELAPVRPAW